MAQTDSRRLKKVGLPPGTLVHVGEKKIDKTHLHLFSYDANGYNELEPETIDACFPFSEAPTITWLNVDGLHEVDIIEQIGSHLDIHPLVLEDILHTAQRPKVEDYGHYIYIVLKMLSLSPQHEIKEEQISLLLAANYLISFQEDVGDVFEPVRDRIRSIKFQSKKLQVDYLAYSLIDAVVDHYFIILEEIGEEIETAEDNLLNNPNGETLQQIYVLKRKLVTLRKSAWPTREVISNLQREDSNLIHHSTQIYLKDAYDHSVQVIDTLETYRDLIGDMIDLYLSNISIRLNEVMKVLTMIATIFIPLTFIAGVYGMNFEFMPELKWRYGYPLVWLLMGVISIGMIFYFRKKKWL